ncbi:hypothetical protein [Methylovulum psychrotolerans]|uniref:CopG family transcriptional regulator n=1 Tax=Methylovulum psychrotolerans TaxID=1704499 RepID=A0A1Z4BVQ6_9GAMM|nr:hypothetical protein [Methylovulum psychrotolerans]ASF45376.1 hypothetical protein CEK71_04450 [Methylovulum psychrotolerans]
MATLTAPEQGKVRTTLYLTQENRERLDRIPRGQKTALMNKAIANALEEIEREENAQKFLKMLATIQPVKTEYSSEQMVRMLREGKEQELLDNKMKHAK